MESHLQEALALGQMVLHRSGEEGIDELWGEPFKAFAFPIEEFYQSRYLKIAQTMRDIDRLGDELCATFERLSMFAGIDLLIADLIGAAQVEVRDPAHRPGHLRRLGLASWSAAERLMAFQPLLVESATASEQLRVAQGLAADPRGQGPDHVHHPGAGPHAQEHARVRRTLRALPELAPSACPARHWRAAHHVGASPVER